MNEVNLIGYFTKEFSYSHTTNNINFYISNLCIRRKSNIVDNIPIITQEPVINIRNNYYIHGGLRVFNRRGHSFYYVYPDYIYPISEECNNSIELIGTVYSLNEPRDTPLGSKILDVMMLVNNYKIPLIFWNSLSESKFVIGDTLHIKGRIQSREYIKDNKWRTVIEVSVNDLLKDPYAGDNKSNYIYSIPK